jgi:sulfate transport system substrate-binding protein
MMALSASRPEALPRLPPLRGIHWRFVLRRLVLATLVGLIALYALWPWLPWARGRAARTVVLYGFSVINEVMNEAIFPLFRREWRARNGEKVEFISAFGGSGTITNQIILGVPAEIAVLSLELDALRILEKGVLASPTWRGLPHAGVVNRTPFVILVRPGNPKGIRDFADLARPGIGVVHPDPLTSGGAQWAILAEYGSVLREGGDESLAYQQLLGIWKNVVAQASSARAARTQFENGFGDALVTYEQEALWDRKRGKLKADIVYPRSTVLSEHTVVVIDHNVGRLQRELIDTFVALLWSEDAQKLFVEHGFRSVDDSLNRDPSFGTIEKPFLVSDFGGWPEVKRRIVDGVWRERVLKEIGK